MRDGVIADYRVTEAMLRYFIGKTLGMWNIFKPEVMISVPAGVTSTEKRSVVEAAVKAGAKSAFVVKEPILAAIGAGVPIHEAIRISSQAMSNVLYKDFLDSLRKSVEQGDSNSQLPYQNLAAGFLILKLSPSPDSFRR